ncbi:MAG: CheB methylesterase domain-containing protein [Candidatus Hinthialibacter antarcticus]|nr:CheB methylesterase domain-containing protein [Candidatus Hinthialibacter antarcticus]
MSQITFAISCQDKTLKTIVQSIVETIPNIQFIEIQNPIETGVVTHCDIILLEQEAGFTSELESTIQKYSNLSWIVVCSSSMECRELKKRISSGLYVEFLFKKSAASHSELERYYSSFFSGFLSYYRTQRTLHSIQTSEKEAKAKTKQKPFDLVAIACSTGGPDALKTIIPNLPANLGVPILIVQHMPAEFTRNLANNLDNHSQLFVTEAKDGGNIDLNSVYIAPGGFHMKVKRLHHPMNGQLPLRLRLTTEPPVNNCRPSADVLFTSLSKEFNGHVLAVVLTGMGVDGREGVKELQKTNTYCLTQRQDTCVVYGMPKAVIEAGLSNETLPLASIAKRISSLLKPDGELGNE